MLHTLLSEVMQASSGVKDMAVDMIDETKDNGTTGGTAGDGGSAFDSAREALGTTFQGFREQAEGKAREYTSAGKEKTVEALGNVASLINDAASAVDEKLGAQYAGYVRQAADAVSGVTDTLRQKDADELFDNARDMIRSSPTIAIAAAAAIGFAVARVVKAGFPEKDDAPATPMADPAPVAAKPKAPKAKAPATAPADDGTITEG
jgi:ElaB/YqjD/DUF883 family membrane-anchored ribosome-binding protein